MIVNFDRQSAIDYVHNHSDEESWKKSTREYEETNAFFHKLTCLEAISGNAEKVYRDDQNVFTYTERLEYAEQ